MHMATIKFEYFEDERSAVEKIFLFADRILNLKDSTPPVLNPESGKLHHYIETKDHKRRTKRQKGSTQKH